MPSRRWHHLICWIAWLLVGAGSPRDATVQVVQSGPKFINYGSGTVVALKVGDHEHYPVVTAAHLLEYGDSCQVVHDGKRYSAKVIASDTESDVAVLDVASVKLPHVTIGEQAMIGESVVTWGFPCGEYGKGQRKRLTTRVVPTNFVDVVQVADYTEDGHSGGGLFKGEKLIGVSSANTGRTQQSCALFAPISAIHRMLHSASQRICQGFD